MVPKTFETADGSVTCFDEVTHEFFHNKFGAYTEAQLNYVAPSALLELFTTSRNISMLDAPFGLGYNSLVLLQELLDHDADSNAPGVVNLVGIESEASFVQVVEQVVQDNRFEGFRLALGENFNKVIHAITNFRPITFQLGKIKTTIDLRLGDMRKIVPQLAEQGFLFDAILHDPFSPNKMPELWTTDLFKLYRKMMPETGRLCTYSVSVIVRGGLQEAGFHVYRTQPLGEKSGGTVATATALDVIPSNIRMLEEADQVRLKTKSGVPLRDANLSTDRAEIRQRRVVEQEQFSNSMPYQCRRD